MNERIKELEKQAASFAETAYNKQTMATFHTNKSAEEIFREKFAELIVEESFRVALVEGKGYLDPIKLRNAMKKHFGVEE